MYCNTLNTPVKKKETEDFKKVVGRVTQGVRAVRISSVGSHTTGKRLLTQREGRTAKVVSDKCLKSREARQSLYGRYAALYKKKGLHTQSPITLVSFTTDEMFQVVSDTSLPLAFPFDEDIQKQGS